MPATCTKQDLQKEAKRLAEWTTDKYTGYRPGNIYRDFPEYHISSKAKRHFQSWIDTATASCQIMGADPGFEDVTHAVYVMMDRFWRNLERAAFFCRGPAYFAAETQTQGREVGREVGALALIYSIVIQLVDALPQADEGEEKKEEEKFGAFVLQHLRDIDGTTKTAQAAFDTIAHLLEHMGGGKQKRESKTRSLAILINEVDALYTVTPADGEAPVVDEGSRKLVNQLLAVLASSPSPLRLWVTYRLPGESVYREAGYDKGEHFAVKPHFPGRKHGLDSLDFSAGTELSDRRFRAVRAVSTSPDAVVS